MNLTITPGTIVRLPAQPDWGTGQVQSAIGPRVTVNFAHAGKVTIDLRHADLTIEQTAGDRAAAATDDLF